MIAKFHEDDAPAPTSEQLSPERSAAGAQPEVDTTFEAVALIEAQLGEPLCRPVKRLTGTLHAARRRRIMHWP